MNPPLRSEADREACIAAIVDGTIDCFATDHAPHTADEKSRPFTDAPFGIVGLETALALTLTYLVEPGPSHAGARARAVDRRAARALRPARSHGSSRGSQADLVRARSAGRVDRGPVRVPHQGAQHAVRGLAAERAACSPRMLDGRVDARRRRRGASSGPPPQQEATMTPPARDAGARGRTRVPGRRRSAQRPRPPARWCSTPP